MRVLQLRGVYDYPFPHIYVLVLLSHLLVLKSFGGSKIQPECNVMMPKFSVTPISILCTYA